MKTYIQKLSLVLSSTLVTLAILEFVVFPRLLPSIPLNSQEFLPAEISMFAQSSKRATIPENYILLTGDSYAQGLGDWLHSLNPYGNAAFHSAHVIHEISGRDVISVARGGAGSITGLVFRPLGYLDGLDDRLRFRAPRPDLVILYYYEGNDPLDTLMELTELSRKKGFTHDNPPFSEQDERSPLSNAFAPALANPDLREPERMRAFIRDAYERHRRERPSQSIVGSLYFLRFTASMLARKGTDSMPAAAAPGATSRWEFKRVGPRIIVSGEPYDTPEPLQGPLALIGDTETELALEAYQQALWILRAELSDADMCIVYIPSPLSIYELAEAQSTTATVVDAPMDPVRLRARSDYLRGEIERMTTNLDLQFVDSTPHIRHAARREFLHGPRDWRHLNARGYRLLAEVVVFGCLGSE